ncbi:30S ribosomal protein S18 [Natroniella sulfidigena]|uniref:30S ribosomal protein S18 n=1 Tax=Natroniella sulfidigena TaxID=723921 RepID=UPI00200B1854|nr:30S ribosomal protein S18 [Natroniella sulfidigena]MCK8816644.1 30S ribosomal protein S18 [Natroniella sulfidigena]
MGRGRRKSCDFCANKVDKIDYKRTNILNKYVTDRGKILPRRISGNCAKHQRELTKAIKRARNVALLPFKID